MKPLVTWEGFRRWFQDPVPCEAHNQWVRTLWGTRILLPENVFTRNTLTPFQGALGHYRCQGSQWGLKAGSKSMHGFPPPKWENNLDEGMITKHHWLGQERCTQAAEQSEQTWALRVHSGRDKAQRNGGMLTKNRGPRAAKSLAAQGSERRPLHSEIWTGCWGRKDILEHSKGEKSLPSQEPGCKDRPQTWWEEPPLASEPYVKARPVGNGSCQRL